MSRIRLPISRAAVGATATACLAVVLLLAQPLTAEAAPPPAPFAVSGYSSEQLANAQVIVSVAAARHLPVAAAVLGVAAAMGESSLRNLPYGDDAINPDGTVADSVGLFQQQHWWGSKAERMTPSYAAGAFFTHLARVRNWQGLPPTAAIHAVQRNADPVYYAQFVPGAIELVGRLIKHPAPVPASMAAAATDPAVDVPTGPVDYSVTVPAPATYPDSHAFDALKRTWETEWDLGNVDDTISSAFTDGLGSAGGTVPDDSLPTPDGP